MTRMRTTALIAATALAGAALLTGCSSSSSETATSAAATAAAQDEATEPSAEAAAEGDQMIAPVMVEPGQTEAAVTVGNMVVINVAEKDLAGTTVSTANPDLLEVSQGGEKDGATFNPGAKALAAGTAVLTVTAPDGVTKTDITVTITE